MPIFKAETLENIAYHIFRATGASVSDARVVARHLTESNLQGHDSHGLLRVIQYTSQIKSGVIDPRAKPEVVRETASTAQVDGHKAFGQVVGRFATEVAIKKARKTDISCVSSRNVGHVGRLGAYTTMAAQAGMAAIAFCASGGGVHIQTPFGGRSGRVSTNPISMAFPSDMEGPIMLDFATSVVAEGKLRVAIAKGEKVPEDWIYDKNGNPSTNPADMYGGGAIRPVGGVVGYKGYCLAFLTEIFAGIVARDGFASGGTSDFQESSRISNGHFIIVINPEAFVPLDTLKKEIGELTGYMKGTPLAPGFKEILYPGEKEARTAEERRKTGIDIPDATWQQIKALIEEYGVAEELGPLP
jgi:uncharacterized oxidoreductase